MTVKNIIKIYEKATPDEIQHGIGWYQDAQDTCTSMADKHELPLRVVVGVLAALSPNNKWSRNVGDADDLITAFLNGDGVESVTPCTYKKMRDKAWSILEAMPEDDQHVMTILNGQKIVSFFSNIMGHDTCTIDGHARNIYYGKRHSLTSNLTNIGKREYAKLQDAYNVAAHKLGLKAYELQAITWVAWRRIHNIK